MKSDGRKRASVASEVVAGRAAATNEYTTMTARRGDGTFLSCFYVVEAVQRHFQPANK